MDATVKRTDAERLRLFCELVDGALSRRAVTEGTIRASWSLSSSEEGGLVHDIDTGDDEDLRSLMLDFRKFLASREDVHFPRIAGIVERRVTDEDLRSGSRQNRQGWKRVLAGDIQMHANGHNYTRERCFDIVVNGKLFHTDLAKAEEFDQLPAECQGFVSASVAVLVIRGLEVLSAERNLIRRAIGLGAVAE
jgi:hypothetical protein